MSNNPFIPQLRNPIVEQSRSRWRGSEPVSEAPENDDFDQSGGKRSPQHRAWRFVKWMCLAAVVFLIVVFFVFREIQHYRELYRMSRLVAAAEAETRQWQERQRMAEAREAGLLAELHAEQLPTHSPPIINASFTPPNQRR